eukprot:TRINITY_DN24914_c0_g1_i1.p1 TRINITY_DN24914_c0_g1~~TRINITY_DN24914_c0_g1_i1.p1  ORF type:complete len:169 (+),score=33.87 TRINITY_DN24914_c0_g1_i1:69-509(+)
MDISFDEVERDVEHHALSLPGMLIFLLGREWANAVMAWVHEQPALAVAVLVVAFMLPMLASCGLSLVIGEGDSLLSPIEAARDRLLHSPDIRSQEIAQRLETLVVSIGSNPPSPVAKPGIVTLSKACAAHDIPAIEQALRGFGIYP